MYKYTAKYTDYDDVEREEDLYFNLSKFPCFKKMIIWVHSGNACQETCIIS